MSGAQSVATLTHGDLIRGSLTSVLLVAAGEPGLAQSMHSVHDSMMMPACAADDPVVGVNMKTKMYMTHAQMKAKMSGMSKNKIHQMLMQNHVKLMCQSKAKAMGDKMMKPHSTMKT